MQGSIYSNLGSKLNKANHAFRDSRQDQLLTLKEFLDHKWVIHTNEELKKSFEYELKLVLKKENIFEMITSFFELEQDLYQVINTLDFETNLNFDEFYKNFSPILMRSLLENSGHPENSANILKSIKESFRIALEEEMFELEELKF